MVWVKCLFLELVKCLLSECPSSLKIEYMEQTRNLYADLLLYLEYLEIVDLNSYLDMTLQNSEIVLFCNICLDFKFAITNERYLYLYLCLFLPFSLSLYVCLSASLSIFVHFSPFLSSLSVYLSISQSVSLSLCLSVSLCLSLSLSVPLCISVCLLSLCLNVINNKIISWSKSRGPPKVLLTMSQIKLYQEIYTCCSFIIWL